MPIFKVLLFCIFLSLCAIPFTLIEEINFVNLSAVHPLIIEILGQAAGVLTVLGALLMVFRVFDKYNFAHVFVTRNIGTGFVKGSVIGLVLVVFCTALAWLNGNVSFTLGNFNFLFLLGYILLYVLVGVMEELIFRSFTLLALSERYPVSIGVLITSLLFGLAHYYNPGFTWLAMFNISLVGILLAYCILWKRNIYWAIGIHFGWNFTEGMLLGYKVSGTDAVGLLIAQPKGAAYLSGGNFGIEASIYCTIIMVLAIAYLLIRHRIAPVNEVLAIEEFEEEEDPI